MKSHHSHRVLLKGFCFRASVRQPYSWLLDSNRVPRRRLIARRLECDSDCSSSSQLSGHEPACRSTDRTDNNSCADWLSEMIKPCLRFGLSVGERQLFFPMRISHGLFSKCYNFEEQCVLAGLALAALHVRCSTRQVGCAQLGSSARFGKRLRCTLFKIFSGA
jgi:hypothetical protein